MHGARTHLEVRSGLGYADPVAVKCLCRIGGFCHGFPVSSDGVVHPSCTKFQQMSTDVNRTRLIFARFVGRIRFSSHWQPLDTPGSVTILSAVPRAMFPEHGRSC